MFDMKNYTLAECLFRGVVLVLTSLLATAANAAAPGITGGSNGTATFNLDAAAAYISQPDGQSIYSWGYGCAAAPAGFAPAPITGTCSTMQIPGPTLIVNQGDTVTVTLTNHLPAAAGNTSILFPGFAVTTSGGAPGILTQEAAPSGTVTYTFTATTEGTHSYYSGSQGDLQVEMGLYGALIVLPKSVPVNCTASQGTGTGTLNDQAKAFNQESDFRLAASAYSHAATCYDREYLFQFSEMDARIHAAAEAIATCTGNNCATSMNSVATEPYHPTYFMINGRSMPDDMDPEYAVQYPHQPYNGNPHMHPGELTLLRIIGQGRWQHPFHEHGNHVRILARDGNLLLAPNLVNSETDYRLAGPLLFTTTTTPGQAMDGIFYWTGKGLNWDPYGHPLFNGSGQVIPVGSTTLAVSGQTPSTAVQVTAPWDAALKVWQRGTGDAAVYELAPCFPDANGYYTTDPTAPNYYEWCGDHNKALEVHPFGTVGAGGPVTLPEPSLFVNGAWYGGSPYLGPEAMVRAVGTTPIPPSGTIANSPTSEAGFAYMWHSHNEREITTDNIFPGGMLMMMLVDPRAYVIDESN